ncbi:MAG: apolipoprotein N-acyltransferase, partial [Alphaproteobacteria bacterium]|nr:apolipoprotein N-acyltransferase [Alphaproteobacteria bacterium]
PPDSAPPVQVIWPETAIPWRLDRADTALGVIATRSVAPVILGVQRREAGRAHNALVTLDRSGAVTQLYDKYRLVLFGEYIPFGQLARLVGLRSFAARDGYGYAPGPGAALIETPAGRALPLICYEAIFPQHPRGAPERPDYILQITNDAWFGQILGPYQHLAQARARAIEQGLPLVRVANTGISAVIDPSGRVLQSLPLGTEGYLDARLPPPGAPTLYGRAGDAPILLLLLIGVAYLALRRPQPK